MKKAAKYLIGILMLIITAITVTNIIVVSFSEKYIMETEEISGSDFDYVVVLGCGYIDEDTPTKLLRDRILCGIDVSHTTGVRVLFSGDSENRAVHDEVKVMLNYAYKNDPDLQAEGDVHGTSTYNSMIRLKEAYGAEKIIVVTQKYHLNRAVYIARNLGLEAIGIACDNDDYGPVMVWNNVREVMARSKDFLKITVGRWFIGR